MTERSRWSRMRLAASCSSTMAARFREKNSSGESSFGFRQRKAKNPSPLPSLEGSQRRVIRQVEMDRRDRDVVLLDGLQVRAGDVLPPEGIAADPEILPSARIALLHDRLAVDAFPLARDPHSPDLARRDVGKVHVQKRVLRKPLSQHLVRNLGGEFRRHVEPEVVPRYQGDGDRPDPQEGALHRRRDGARVSDVIPHVPALVDAGHEEVDLSLPENSVRGEIHAIGRRPVDGIYPGPDLFDPKRLRQREGMSRRAPFAIRRDHGDQAQGAERLRERHDPLGPESVVVAHQDEGGRIAHVLPALSGKEMVGATGLEPATPSTPFLSRGFCKTLKTHNYLISLERYDNTFCRMNEKKGLDGNHRSPIGPRG